MKHLLHNPVYHALLSGDQHLSSGTDEVKFFDEQVSPFVGFKEDYAKGFTNLQDLLPPGRKILYANPAGIIHPTGWQVQHEIKGLQFVFETGNKIKNDFSNVRPLGGEHIEQMIKLALLTLLVGVL